jgi:ABC-type amino acid transport substrate-binding protein
VCLASGERGEWLVLKRIGSVVLAVGVIGALTASCAKSESSGAGSTASPTTSASASLASFTTIKEGVLTVGSCLDYPPFESVKNGTPGGFDVELTEAIAAKIGYAGKVNWVKANFDTIFTAVANGQFDVVAAAVTATGKLGKQRAQTVSFSDYYFNSEQAFSVNPAQTPNLTSPDQLKSGDTVGVQKGTTGADWAVTNLQPKGVQIKTYQTGPDAFRDLSAGNLTGVVVDAPVSYNIATTMQDVKVATPIDTNEKYAFAFAPTSTALLDAWNQGFQQVVADGTYQTIFQKYFPGVPVPPEWQPSA